MFVSPAFAQDAGGGSGEGLAALLPLILIFVVFYFLLIRPQQKKMKEHKDMLGMIRRNDRIVTNGGIIGTVIKVVNDDELSVEIADGVRVRVRRELIHQVLSKTEPVKDDKDKGKDANEGAPEAANDQPKGGAAMLKGLLGGKK